MREISQINLFGGDKLEGFGSLGLEDTPAGEAGGIFNSIISTIIGLMTVIAFIWFTFLMITGAYSIMSAGGDKAQLESARKKITTGIIGVIVVIAAIFIVDLIGELIGIPDILDPAKFISPK